MSVFQVLHDRLQLNQGYRAKQLSFSEEERSHLDLENQELLKSIAAEPTALAAEPKLMLLGRIQSVIATLCFRCRIQLSDLQRKLVRQYDRWDDAGVRVATFLDIQLGQFP